MAKTHYEVLQIKRSSTAVEIKSAYRRLVKIYHPDTSSEPNAQQVFVRIVEAYEVLSDPDRKRNYDRVLDLEANAKKAGDAPKQSSVPRPEPRRRVAPSPPSPKVIEQEKSLDQLIRVGRFAEAEKLARNLRAKYPANARPYAVLGDIARMRGELSKAAEYYAYAMQMDPRESRYERAHSEVLSAISNQGTVVDASQRSRVAPLYVLIFVIGGMFFYTCLTRERPAFPQLDLVSTWPITLFLMLFIGGVVLAASLSLAGLLEKFGASSGSASMKVPPAVILGIVTLVNFWIASALYIFVGISQNTFNVSTSRLLSGVAAVCLLLSLACGISAGISPLQTMLWGGNIIYAGAIVGWLTTDAFRR